MALRETGEVDSQVRLRAFDFLEQQKAEVLKSVPTCLVSTSGTPRVVKILKRGDWQDDTGPAVEPQVPLSLGVIPTTEGDHQWKG